MVNHFHCWGIYVGELRVIGNASIVMVGDDVKEDLSLTWRRENAEETARAENIFQEYLNKGWIAIGETDGKKTQIFTFNPNLDKIVLAPMLVGG